MLKDADLLARKFFGVSLVRALGAVAALAMLGALCGAIFPEYRVTGLLHLSPFKAKDRAAILDLQTYKRIAGSYGSQSALKAFLAGRPDAESEAARRLLALGADPDFWSDAITPVLSFSKADQRRFGEFKDGSPALVGLELRTSARTEEAAAQIGKLLADYVGTAWIREEVRAWLLTSKGYAASRESAIRAEILRAELDIQMSERRVDDMKSIMERYPDAKRMEAPPGTGVSGGEGSDRFLSPMMQLVGAESTISARREVILRLKREARQIAILAPFYAQAEKAVDSVFDGGKLLESLEKAAVAAFPEEQLKEDWAAEAAVGVRSELQSFAESRRQTGLRSAVELVRAPSRDPQKLAFIGALAGVALLLLVAVLRSMSGRISAN